MKNFTFEKNELAISLNGCIFKGDPAEIEVHMNAAKKRILEFNEILINGEAQKADIENCIGDVLSRIDDAFGEEACEGIFGDKAVGLHDCADLVSFILAQTEQFEQDKIEKYTGYRKTSK